MVQKTILVTMTLFRTEWPYSEPDFSIRETKMDHFGLFWSAKRTLSTAES